MPSLREALTQSQTIHYSTRHKVEQTVAEELQALIGRVPLSAAPVSDPPMRSILVSVAGDAKSWKAINPGLDASKDWMMLRVQEGKGVEFRSSRPHLLYTLFRKALDEWMDTDVKEFSKGRILHPAFSNLRPVYDIFLIQHARSVRNFDRPTYFKELARLGFSHAEVNGLAYPVPFEQGPKGELLHRFYTYCPALDQFVTSKLTKGYYDEDYLQANLNLLKTNAELAEKYGLTPGIVSFEPRSVPDELLQKYPVLRGARVDHPLRSFRPRFNLSIAHPVVRDHYAEMVQNLLKEVPTISYMSVWSNDSGAGFEYTSSMYVGRNGGGYVIREWKGDKEIAEAAALNLVRYLRTLRDAGRAINPSFRTLIRLEPFWAEHDYIWKELEDGLDVEVSSLQTKGWGLSYKHPKYPEAREIHQMALYNHFTKEEVPLISELQKKGSKTDVYFTPGIIWNHEPLIGIAFPWLVYDKLKDMAAAGVETVALLGGAVPESFAPCNINQELVRAFQSDPGLQLDAFLKQKAAQWVGPDHADDLVKVWKHSDEACRSFPIPIWIYAGWGVWYRLAIRPIIPNIEAIPEPERRYYEDFMLATTHNRTRIDLRYDVGFDLVDPSHASFCVKVMDRDLFPELDKALALLKRMKGSGKASQGCVTDQYDRVRALKNWYRTQRNVTQWVSCVHGYLESKDPAAKKEFRSLLKEMVLDEMENAKDLLDLWETSKTNWMIVSGVGETTFIYYKNFGELVKKKLELMRGHENDEPYVDPHFQWRVPGFEPSGNHS
ncbi:MAG: hypothetical protein WEB33_10935 [Bacteroidota bacterium]